MKTSALIFVSLVIIGSLLGMAIMASKQVARPTSVPQAIPPSNATMVESGSPTRAPMPANGASNQEQPENASELHTAHSVLGVSMDTATQDYLTVGGTYIIEVATRKVWRVAAFPAVVFDWSHDGGKFLVLSGYESRVADVVDLITGDVWRFTGPSLRYAALAPNGRQFVYVAEASGNEHNVVIANRDGSGEKLLAKTTGFSLVSWSADGARIAVQESTGESKLFVVEMASQKVFSLGKAHWNAFSWSSDATMLALASEAGVTVYNVASGVKRTLPWPLEPGQLIRWSPDGKYFLTDVAYRNRPGRTMFSLELDGGTGPVPLGEIVDTPSWAPDGQTVAFVNFGCESQDFDLYLVRPDGQGRRRLTNEPRSTKVTPIWSPSGKSVAYGSRDKIVVVDVDAAQSYTLLEGQGMPSLPHLLSWSPDGRFLAFNLGGGKGYCF